MRVAKVITLALLVGALGMGVVALGWHGADDHQSAGKARAESKPHPNVVVIMTDDQRYDDLSPMRALRRRVAAQGVTFERAFSSFPLCCPARASLFTGQYAHNHGVRHNRPPDGGFEAYDDQGSLPIALRRAGYRTGFIGKYLNGYAAATAGDPGDIPAGWDVWHAQLDGALFNWRLNSNGRIREFGGQPRQYQTDVYARKAAGFIARSAGLDDPFFLVVVPFAPHLELVGNRRHPPRPAPRHSGAFSAEPIPRTPAFNRRDVSDKPFYVRVRPRLGQAEIGALERRYRARLASLLAVDDLVAEVMRSLRETGELADTLVIFTSDNGYFLGEHRLLQKGHLYDEAVRVPLMMRGPGIPSGVVRNQLVANIDLAPTILALTEAQEIRPTDGIDLLPLMQHADVGRDRDLLLENRTAVGVRTTRWLYVEHDYDGDGSPDEFELYDMRMDPHQLESLIGPENEAPRPSLAPEARARIAAQQGRLAERLRRLRSCKTASCH